jgi:hypothetical protein
MDLSDGPLLGGAQEELRTDSLQEYLRSKLKQVMYMSSCEGHVDLMLKWTDELGTQDWHVRHSIAHVSYDAPNSQNVQIYANFWFYKRFLGTY